MRKHIKIIRDRLYTTEGLGDQTKIFGSLTVVQIFDYALDPRRTWPGGYVISCRFGHATNHEEPWRFTAPGPSGSAPNEFVTIFKKKVEILTVGLDSLKGKRVRDRRQSRTFDDFQNDRSQYDVIAPLWSPNIKLHK